MSKRAEITEIGRPAPKAPVAAQQPTPRWKIVLPIVIIAGSLAWVGYLLLSGRQQPVELSPQRVTANSILDAIGDREDLLEGVSVRVEGEPGAETLKVTGYVKTKALLDELTGIVNTSKGAATVDMNVVIRP